MAAPTLLLIHGLGATPGVWADVERELAWPGSVVAAELPGHGAAAPSPTYTVDALAAAVAAQCSGSESVLAVGHSLGGVVALALASGTFGPSVSAAIGIGIKLAWTEADVAGMAKVAAKGVRWFPTRDEAVARFLVQAGLQGVADASHPAVHNAVIEVDGQWRVAQDPQTFAQQPVDAASLVSAATCPILLGAGEHDAMVSHADMATYVSAPLIAAGCGHNVQVENPGWIADLIRSTSSS